MKKALVLAVTFVMVLMTACGVSEKDKAMVRGTVENGVFTSEFAGFKFAPPETWTYASDEEILAQMNLTAEDMDTAEKAQYELGKQKTIMDAMVVDETGANVIVMYENLALTIGGTKYDEKAYGDVLKEQSEASGFTEFAESSVKIGDNEYYVLECTSSLEGYTMKQHMLLRKIDNYMCAIAITTIPDLTATYDDIIKMFS